MRTVLGVASYLCVLAMTVVFAGTASANPDELPVQVSALPDLMLNAQEVSSVMGANLYVSGDGEALATMGIDRPDCGSVIVASAESYDRSNYLAGRYREFLDAPGWLKMADQSMTIFPEWADATDFALGEADRWRACENQRVTMLLPQPDGSTRREWVQLRKIVQVQEVLVVGYTWPTDFGGVIYCQHALAPLRNVAIDVRACAERDGSRALDLILGLLPRVARA
ncbi:Hypothetical conserved membrane protein PknM or conserved lipoprotein LppH [Mycobacteroides abscessus subsp. massiliense]|uniref:Hypothetical conserved membrane protein PknM or conserved lipoprotein LppH n=3 Tax=Mycobacteroides abscessus TaxID=36809 RepID=A0A0U1AVI3_9MYCO|nr:Hypothetical conserved membrane protein PknM or conserved lipoprotein LppH [Mycobacteroides abscessus]SKH61701.1 membrane protein PknM or lipoprotein LppH [Mycobacteroides abscessus subsp. massiliense]CPW48113.1 Hypothetical conserved membrane protein PknM or conserved lipoprotein LppH [Mycobacteroides abscessus]SKH74466.1 membrane protein PknM or lipoprotein LppH [Mycobacteroides abscessus subsp. massiliense]SKI09271.1 membrane protein PknM or lipoprotein LppH [Mycobacteroides abscessus sub